MRRSRRSISFNSHARGFTLVEVVVVLIISAILVSVALRSGMQINDAAKVEETKAELESLEYAIVGNPSVQNNGARADFGYVGDVGALPPDLDALAANPGGYATWRGPYVKTRFTQLAEDYKRDAWGELYTYSGGGMTIRSSGSGDNIDRTFGNSAGDLLRNMITGNLFDVDGTPPGATYDDSIQLYITIPNGTGGTATKTVNPNASGYFEIDSIPIGNHVLSAVYLPEDDTLATFIPTLPGADAHVELRFNDNLWGAVATSGIIPVHNSDSLTGSPPCSDVVFWITNTTSSSITVTSFSFTWSSPTAYYAEVEFGGNEIFDKDGSPRGVSGTTYPMSSSQTINAGQSIRVKIEDFRQSNTSGGGSPASMSGTTLTMVLSNGSVITVDLPLCP